MFTTARHRVFSVSILLLFAFGATLTAQQDGSAQPAMVVAANGLVQEALSKAGTPSAVTVTFENLSSLSNDSQEAAKNAVMTAFRDAGIRLVKPEQAMATVRVTFSEDWQGYVWIAAIQQGPGRQLVMKRLQRADRVAQQHGPTLTLRKYSVWLQETPILDFYFDNQHFVVLEPGQISFYTRDSGQLRLRSVLSIAHSQIWPRDLRGRLQVHDRQVTAFLPGTRCTGSLSDPSLDCRASDDPWPIDRGPLVAFYSSRRNFFNGVLSGPRAATVNPFFSAAAWNSGDQQFWLFAGADGRTRFYQNDLSTVSASFGAWGSNLAALHSGCGSGWQIVATAPTDNLRPDILQAVEIAGRDAQSVSPALDMQGPVTAMWPSGKNDETVNVVVQSPITGKYEALIITVSCN